jgi:type IV pilus assembly protein PilV
MHLNAARASGRRHRGFSLVEVMVALIICAIGLLGLAKMEAVGLASTTVSNSRSLVALEVGGMAATMHANRAYWASTNATTGATITGSNGTVTQDATLANVKTCYNTVCSTPSDVAAYDVQHWGQTLYNMIPSYTATIACAQGATTPALTPVTCTIAVTWFESTVAANSQQTGITQANFTTTQQPTYTLFVQP